MKFAALTLLATVTLAGTAIAADAPVSAPAAPAPAPAHHFNKADTNNDGFVTKDEWRARGDQMFNEIDTNHDGKLSPEEMKAHREKEHADWQQRHVAFGGNTPAPAAAPATAATPKK